MDKRAAKAGIHIFAKKKNLQWGETKEPRLQLDSYYFLVASALFLSSCLPSSFGG